MQASSAKEIVKLLVAAGIKWDNRSHKTSSWDIANNLRIMIKARYCQRLNRISRMLGESIGRNNKDKSKKKDSSNSNRVTIKQMMALKEIRNARELIRILW